MAIRSALAVLGAALLVASLAGPSAAAGFNAGDAQASADTFSLNIKAANATIGFTFGRSIAQYRDRTGSAEGRALDLGALPTLFGGEQCDGSPPLLNPATLPPLTRADSAVAGADSSRRVQAFQPGLNGGPAGDPAGFQDATATVLPSSRAITESVPADIFLLAVDGGRTEVTTQLKDQVREARAVVTADQLRILGGLFTINRPRWEAVARSGADTATTGSFTFDSATLFGIPRTNAEVLADLAGFKSGIEQLLAPLGVRFEMPTVQVRDDGVRVTPMAFRVENPPFGTQVLIPFLGRIDPLVQALRQAAVREDCRNQTALTVLDVLLGVLGGSGSIEILAGGADAATHDVDYTVAPIADAPPAPSAPAPVVADGTEVTDPLPPADLALTDLPAVEPLDTPLAPVDALGTGVSALPAARRSTTRTATAGVAALPASGTSFEDGAAGGAGVVVGAAALAGALAMSAGDRLLGRRRRRSIP
ncbi:MAG: hypothetical protein ACOYOP_09040 [Microthrixaceae bacterium]